MIPRTVITLALLVAGCAEQPEPRRPRRASQEPVPVSVADEDAPQTAGFAPAPPRDCKGPHQAELDALKLRASEATTRREEWTASHCTPTVGRSAWTDARGVRHENGSEPLWVCDGTTTDDLSSREEREIAGDMMVLHAKIKHCEQAVGPFSR